MDEETKVHLSSRATWMRLVYMLLFAVAFYVIEFILIFVVVIQFLFKLVSGEPMRALTLLGQSLGTYVYQIILFTTFSTEDMPYPFGKWPKGPPALKRSQRKVRRKESASVGPEQEEEA